MKKARSLPRLPADTAWLGRVQEVLHPIDQIHPVRVTESREMSARNLPRPTIPYPERHPYCEIGFVFQGRGLQFIGTEKFLSSPGTLSLTGPGLPHYGILHSAPMWVISVHFLPIVLFEMGPAGDGARLLARFTAPKTIRERITVLPPSMRRRFGVYFESLVSEFARPRFGTELQLRSILVGLLVDFLRWEESKNRAIHLRSPASNWIKIEKILRFIYRHYQEPLYVGQLAREAGLNKGALHELFDDAFGMTCIQYLRSYRISQASALLRLPDSRVAEVAQAVGFETLSHFNTSFHKFLGMSPTDYMHRQG